MPRKRPVLWRPRGRSHRPRPDLARTRACPDQLPGRSPGRTSARNTAAGWRTALARPGLAMRDNAVAASLGSTTGVVVLARRKASLPLVVGSGHNKVILTTLPTECDWQEYPLLLSVPGRRGKLIGAGDVPQPRFLERDI